MGPLALRLPLPLQFLLYSLAAVIGRAQQGTIDYLRAENAVLLELLDGRPRLTDGQRRRLAEKAKPLGRATLAQVAQIATPDTILRWFRELVAQKYDGSAARAGGSGRPRVVDTITRLIVRLARENPTFGHTRIRDALENLGLTVSRSTVARVRKENGLEPAGRRGTSWKDFLAAHWDLMFGADFFSVEVMTLAGPVRYLVLFFMELKTRRVHIAGIVRDDRVTAAWLTQVARNLTDAVDGFLPKGA